MPAEKIAIARVSFWVRQFARDVSHGQLVFDLTAGLLLPIVCLIADPIVFKGAAFGAPLLGSFACFAYIFVGIEIGALIVWLLSQRFPALHGGVLAAGGLFSLCLGIILLPFSIISLFVAIGVLGLTPFITSFVYWRNSLRAIALAWGRDPAIKWMVYSGLGLLLASVIPLAAQWSVWREVTRATATIIAGEAASVQPTIARLRWLRAVADLDTLVLAYRNEIDPLRRERLADAYRQITGIDLEQRLTILND